VFDAIAAEFAAVARSLGLAHVSAIPLSALEGDMVVHRGERLGWYDGPTLLETLERARSGTPAAALRFPVQLVSRVRFGDKQDLRGYLGRVESGSIAVGNSVTVWPHRVDAIVVDLVTLEGSIAAAGPGRSVTIVLDRQIDVARGDVLSHRVAPPRIVRRFGAKLAWMDREPLSTQGRYWLKQGTRTVRARIETLESRLDLDTLQPQASATLDFNDLGHARIAVAQPIVADRYRDNRASGSFILVDEATHHTVAAGMIDEVELG
jgi:sulfate adenylyltransferase subunit 1